MNFDIDKLKENIKNHKIKPLNVSRYYSIFIPLVKVENSLHLLYELRSKTLKTQAGEISFPGGRIEENEGIIEAAVRETSEELNVNANRLEIWGKLDYLLTPYNILIYSCAGYINNFNLDNLEVNKEEVEEVFTVPLDYLLKQEAEVYNMSCTIDELSDFPYHLIQNGRDYKWREGKYPVYFYKYRKRIIWGFTAMMTKNFLDKISNF